MNEVVESTIKTAKKVSGITKESALTVLVTANPKRPSSASYKRFEGYLTDPAPATVGAALENGLTIGDIKFDLVHGSIEVEGAVVEEYEVKPRGPRVAKDEDGESSDVIAEAGDEDF